MTADRILVFLSTLKDAERTRRALSARGLDVALCSDIEELCREIRKNAGAAVVGEDAVDSAVLRDTLRDQPAWSDFPLIVLADKGTRGRGLPESMNLFLVSRPIKVRAMTSMVRAALRLRRHQYAVRDHLETLDRQRERDRIALSQMGDAAVAGDASGQATFVPLVAESSSGWPERQRLAETLSLAVAAAELGTWEWDPSTDLMTISRRAGEIYGIPPGSHSREGLRVLIHPEHRDRARQEAVRAVAERIDYDIEYPLQSGLWVAARGRGVYDESGAMLRMLGVVADVTQRKQSELALRESESLNRVLVDLVAATHPLTESSDIMTASARILAEHLGADRCAFAEVEAESTYVITGDHTRGTASIVGRWPVGAFGAEHLRLMRANEPYVVNDAHADSRITAADLPAFLATDIRAVICVPLHKDGDFTAAMAVHQSTARKWTDAEIRVVRTVVGHCWEALERARVARELRDIRSRMEAALEAGAIGTWAWDVQADRFYGDASLARIFGAAREALSGGPISGLLASIHPDDRERVGELVAAALRTGGRYEADYRVIGSGECRWVTARGQAELDSEGRAARFPGVVIDITKRKKAEQALLLVREESERKRRLYETALSNTPDLVYVFGLDHRFYYANDALLRMWGKTWDEAIGKTCLELGYEAWHAARHDDEIEQVIATRKPIRGEVPFTGTNGRRVYDYIFVPVFGANGEVEAVAGTTRDITDRQAMEQELREADRKKDEFIALLAHELRNPLAPIRNGLEVMRLARENPQVLDEAQSMMDRQLRHMVRLVDDLLDVSRISRNKMELRRTRVSLTEVIANAVETARPLLDEAKHELSVSLPASPVHLDADLTRLAQVFGNLLANSAKYTPRGGRIWLSAERKEGVVEVAVTDTGIGIPSASLSNIFEMFSQVDRSIERSSGGLGIGLALVKGLVEMHSGSVQAASDGEGKGSTFTVSLPVLGELASPIVAPREGERGPSRRVLVVDDNHDGADSLAMTLRLLGNEVRTAYDGADAIDVAEAFRPEVILMDIGMPRMNGLEATRRIRALAWSQGALIIALTGWGQESDRAASREAGCDSHLVKPLNLLELERLLARSTRPSGRDAGR